MPASIKQSLTRLLKKDKTCGFGGIGYTVFQLKLSRIRLDTNENILSHSISLFLEQVNLMIAGISSHGKVDFHLNVGTKATDFFGTSLCTSAFVE